MKIVASVELHLPVVGSHYGSPVYECECLDELVREGITIEEIVKSRVLVRHGPSIHCFCGRRLHYNDKLIGEQITQLCRERGEYMRVTTPAGTYLVPRHFIALHGIKAEEVPRMGFEKSQSRSD